MGSGASTGTQYELTPEEKVEITKVSRSDIDALPFGVSHVDTSDTWSYRLFRRGTMQLSLTKLSRMLRK
jgi:hypothetical protein